MRALRIEGYVIVSADGMLADARNVMPDELKFEGDKAFFTAALDRADLILHGRNSFEDQPNSPRRKRVILTHEVDAIATAPFNPKATMWNPAGATFEAACAQAGVHQDDVDRASHPPSVSRRTTGSGWRCRSGAARSRAPSRRSRRWW